MTGTAAEEALDELEDNVGIDGFDDDEDEDDEDGGFDVKPAPQPAPRVVAMPVMEPAKRAPKKAPPRAPVRSGPGPGVLREAAKAQTELEDFLSGLAFGEDQHRIIVSRLEPTHDPNTGENITGTLKTYYTPIGVEEIQKAYGGGLYELRIMGPDPLSGRKIALRKRETLRIAGKPRLDSDRDAERKAEAHDPKTEIFMKALESKEREVERLAKEARDAQRMLLEAAMRQKEDGSGTIATVLSLVKEQQSKAESSVAALMESMREERRLEEQRRREDREREEDRRREEREEARRLREEENRRFQMELEERRRQHEKELAMLQVRQSNEASESARMTEMMMKLMENSRKEEQERAREEKRRQDDLAKMQFEVMQSGNRQAVEMVMESSKFQMGMLTEALKEAKQTKKGGISEMAQELLAVKQLTRELTGEGDEPEESTAEKIFNKIEGMVPSLATAAASIMSARQAVSAAPQRAALPEPTRLAFVDQGPVGQPAAQPQQTRAQDFPQEPSEQIPEEEVAANTAANDFKDFHFPAKTADITEVVTTLVKNLDLAVQQGKDAEDVADDILPYYAKTFPTINFMLKSAPADELVKFIEERVPQSWAIASPAGEKLLRDLHDIVHDD